MTEHEVNFGSIQQLMRAQYTDKEIFNDAQKYAYEYINGAYERNVFPSESALEQLSAFDEDLPIETQNAPELLRLLHEKGSPATSTLSGGRYFGFVNGGTLPIGVAARWLSDVWDQNAGLYIISPIASKLEEVSEKWLIELFGLHEDSVAGFVGGTSTATLSGLAAGRYRILANSNWDVGSKGLFGAPKIRVILSEHAHGTVFKALSLLGLGRDNVERVPVDKQGRIDIEQMPEIDERTIVIAQAGHVSSGSFDPIDEICNRAADVGAWVHIDGAFGLWAAASEHKKQLTKGIEKANSLSVDAHKTLNTPYDCGIILCSDEDALLSSMALSGSYIQVSENRDGMDYTPDMSRRSRVVELWASLKFLGKNGIEELVDGLCDRAVQFGDELAENGFRILNDIVFNQVLVACDTPAETKATLENIQSSGECWCSGAEWNNEPVIRISVCSWATTPEDVKRSVKAFVAARDLAKQ